MPVVYFLYALSWLLDTFFFINKFFFVLLPIKKEVWEIFVSRIVLPMIFVSIVLPLSFVV